MCRYIRNKLYMRPLGAKPVALDAKSGEPVWDAQIACPEFGYGETMASTAIGSKILIRT